MSSARAALLLTELGFLRVRPLRGGVAGWRERGHPVEPIRARWTPAQMAKLPNRVVPPFA